MGWLAEPLHDVVALRNEAAVDGTDGWKRGAVGDVRGWVEDDVSEACQRTERIAVFGVGGYYPFSACIEKPKKG